MRRLGRATTPLAGAGRALAISAGVAVMLTGLIACSAVQGASGSSSGTAVGGSGAGFASGGSTTPQTAASPSHAVKKTARSETAKATGSSDWQHTLQVVADLRAQPPAKPLVLMLGSSIVRESIASDASWAAQVHQLGGQAVLTYGLGSRNQTFGQDLKLVPFLPKAPTIVYIGVDVVRFVSAPATLKVVLPTPAPVPASYDPHRYSGAHILSATQKRKLVADWVTNRYPVFSANYAYNRGQLERLIAACLARGLHPVLLDTPRNTAIIGHSFDKPVSRYRATCRQLAAKYGIPFVDMVASARFGSTDFYDMWHAVQPGRAKWQLLLSGQTVKLLRLYGMGR